MNMNLIEIIDRMKQLMNIKNDSDVAELLNINQSTFAERKRRNSVPYEEIIKFCDKQHIAIDYILLGKGPIIAPGELQIYNTAPSSMIEEGEVTYMTNNGPMAWSDICLDLGMSSHELDKWLGNHARWLQETKDWLNKHIFRDIRYAEDKLYFVVERVARISPGTNTDLINKMKTIFERGSVSQRGLVRGTIDEIFDDIKKQ